MIIPFLYLTTGPGHGEYIQRWDSSSDSWWYRDGAGSQHQDDTGTLGLGAALSICTLGYV